MSGKGDTPRPIPDPETFERNWKEIDWNARDREKADDVVYQLYPERLTMEMFYALHPYRSPNTED